MTCGGKDSEHVIVSERQPATCRFCNQSINWGKTNAGKNALLAANQPRPAIPKDTR